MLRVLCNTVYWRRAPRIDQAFLHPQSALFANINPAPLEGHTHASKSSQTTHQQGRPGGHAPDALFPIAQSAAIRTAESKQRFGQHSLSLSLSHNVSLALALAFIPRTHMHMYNASLLLPFTHAHSYKLTHAHAQKFLAPTTHTHTNTLTPSNTNTHVYFDLYSDTRSTKHTHTDTHTHTHQIAYVDKDIEISSSVRDCGTHPKIGM